MLAFALRADGWYLRSEISWCKKNCMPESIKDRPSSATESVFLLAKSASYYYDSEAVKEKLDSANMKNYWLLSSDPIRDQHFAAFPREIPYKAILTCTSAKGVCRNCGAPWIRIVKKERLKSPETDQRVYSLNHHKLNYLSSSYKINKEFIGWKQSCDCVTNDPVPAVVLDPFSGAGTTGLVAGILHRDFIGIELNPKYVDMSVKRINKSGGFFYKASAVYEELS